MTHFLISLLFSTPVAIADTKMEGTAIDEKEKENKVLKGDFYSAVAIAKGEFRMGCSMEQGYYCGRMKTGTCGSYRTAILYDAT